MSGRRLSPEQQLQRELRIAERDLAYGRSKRRRRQMRELVARRGWRR